MKPRIEDIDRDGLKALYAKTIGRPCMFLKFKQEGDGARLCKELGIESDALFERITNGNLMVLSFDSDDDAMAWYIDHDQDEWPFFAQCFLSNGESYAL